MAETHQKVDAFVDQVTPTEAYELLRNGSATALIDVRTRAEWAFVGLPDLTQARAELWPVEWEVFPAMSRNPGFLAEVTERLDGREPGRLLFICRSGKRSMAAAQLVAAVLANQGIAAHCTNVAEGFEGDPDAEGHRGRANGWKVRGLPWRQS